MRGQCIICTDYFEKDKDVAAMPCGHTFHDECLSKWLSTSKSCPQCRKALANKERPIHRLFFMETEDSICVHDDSEKLRNMLEDARLSLRKKERERQQLESENSVVQSQLAQMEEARNSVEKRLRDERESNALLKKELKTHKQLQARAEAAISEAEALRIKLRELGDLQRVLTGCEDEVQETLARYSGGGNEARQQVMMIVLLKRELDTSRQERRELRNASIRLKRELSDKKGAIGDLSEQLASVTAHLDCCQSDLRSSEVERDGLKRRLDALTSALESPAGNPSASLAKRLLRESPAPAASTSPRTPAPPSKCPSRQAALAVATPARATVEPCTADTTLQLFDDSTPAAPATTASRRAIREAEALDSVLKSDGQAQPDLETSKLAASGVKKLRMAPAPAVEPVRDVSNIVGFGRSLSIMRKKEGSAFFRNGYDGLGGHGMHINAPLKPVALSSQQKCKKRAFVLQKKPPTLTMHDYIVLE